MSTNTIKQTKEGKFKLVLSRIQWLEMQGLIEDLVQITSEAVDKSRPENSNRVRLQLLNVIISELWLRKLKDFMQIAEENHITLRMTEALCLIELVRLFGPVLENYQLFLGWVLPELHQKTA